MLGGFDELCREMAQLACLSRTLASIDRGSLDFAVSLHQLATTEAHLAGEEDAFDAPPATPLGRLGRLEPPLAGQRQDPIRSAEVTLSSHRPVGDHPTELVEGAKWCLIDRMQAHGMRIRRSRLIRERRGLHS